MTTFRQRKNQVFNINLSKEASCCGQSVRASLDQSAQIAGFFPLSTASFKSGLVGLLPKMPPLNRSLLFNSIQACGGNLLSELLADEAMQAYEYPLTRLGEGPFLNGLDLRNRSCRFCPNESGQAHLRRKTSNLPDPLLIANIEKYNYISALTSKYNLLPIDNDLMSLLEQLKLLELIKRQIAATRINKSEGSISRRNYFTLLSHAASAEFYQVFDQFIRIASGIIDEIDPDSNGRGFSAGILGAVRDSIETLQTDYRVFIVNNRKIEKQLEELVVRLNDTDTQIGLDEERKVRMISQQAEIIGNSDDPEIDVAEMKANAYNGLFDEGYIRPRISNSLPDALSDESHSFAEVVVQFYSSDEDREDD